MEGEEFEGEEFQEGEVFTSEMRQEFEHLREEWAHGHPGQKFGRERVELSNFERKIGFPLPTCSAGSRLVFVALLDRWHSPYGAGCPVLAPPASLVG